MAANMSSAIHQMFFTPAGQPASGDVLVYIFLRGGADGLNMVAPVGDRYYAAYRPTIKLLEPAKKDVKSGIDLNGFFVLHPALAPLKKFYLDKSLAVVHAVGLPDPTYSHTDAQANLERGSLDAKSITTGWLGRHLASKKTGAPSPLRAVGFGPILPAVLRGPAPAVALQTLDSFNMPGSLQNQTEYMNYLQSLYQAPGDNFGIHPVADATKQALGVLAPVKTLDYASPNFLAYPQSRFGQALVDTFQLINAGIGLEVVCLEMDGWDTHTDEGSVNGTLNRLLLDLGQGLAAFATDLGDRLKNVLVMTVSEFGRRVPENGSHGTDHGHGNAMFLLGGGVLGGKVYGTWPTLTPNKLVGAGDLDVTTDTRDVFAEVLQNRLANPALTTVFPDYTPKPVGVVKPL